MSFDPKRLKELMVARKITLAVAESLTSGHVQAAIGSVSGASDYFLGGITAYAIPQKVKHLHVNEAHARKVPHPYAYVVVWQRSSAGGVEIANQRVEGAGRTRVEMQEHVTEIVLESLQRHIESL